MKMMTPEEINKTELMQYYNYKGKIGELRLYKRLLRTEFLQFLASVTPHPNLAVKFHRMKGCKIGRHVYIGPNVYIDTVYPHLVKIEDYVSIGRDTMIFAHSNPTNSLWLKKRFYPRKVAPVIIKRGAWIAPRVIILCGTIIGKNSVIGAGSIVTKDVDPYSVYAGIPAKKIKDLIHARYFKNRALGTIGKNSCTNND